MKKVILLAVLSIFGISIKSNAQDSTKTLLHLSRINSIGIYAAPEFQYGQLHSQFTPFAGGSLMFMFNKRFAIGGTMMHSTDRSFSPAGVSPLVMNANFGGLKMEYTLNPNSAIHLSFPLLIGGGSASADSAFRNRRRPLQQDTAGFGTFQPRNRSDYFVIQPGIQLEGNLLPFLKLYIGANYRFAFDRNTSLLPADNLQGFSASVGIKAGLFDIPVRRKSHNQ